MIKPTSFFIISLLTFAAIQLHNNWNDPTISGPVDHLVTQPMVDMAIPEDTLAFSGSYWHQRVNCHSNEPRYIGYSDQQGKALAVIHSRNQEHLYSVGDALKSDDQARIISFDDNRLVLRYADRVVVLCRDASQAEPPVAAEKTTRPSVQHISVATPVNPSAPAEYRSTLGVLTPVTNTHNELTGYKIKKCLQYCWLMRRFALQEGDVLTSVQGVPVNGRSPQQISALLKRSESDIELQLQRNGKTEHITLPWKKIAPLIKFMNKGSFL